MTQQPQPPRTPPASAAPRPGQPTIGELLGRISENISGLIRGEIELTKAKALRVASTAGAGAALLGAAAVADLLALVMPVWAAKLIVAVVLFAAAVAAALLGRDRLKEARTDLPEPQVRLREDVDAVKKAVASGLEKGGRQ